jgi:hypothetical protein
MTLLFGAGNEVTPRRSPSIRLFFEYVGQGAAVTRRRRTSMAVRSAPMAMTTSGPLGLSIYGVTANFSALLGSALGLLWRTVRRSTVGPAIGEVATAMRQPLPAANDHRFNGAEMASPWTRDGPF